MDPKVKPSNPAAVIRTARRLSRTAMKVYGEIVFFCGTNGFTWRSREQMAEHIGISVRTLQRALKELTPEKLIFVERRGTKKGRQGLEARTWLCLTPDLEAAGFRERTEATISPRLIRQNSTTDATSATLPPTDATPYIRKKNPPPTSLKKVEIKAGEKTTARADDITFVSNLLHGRCRDPRPIDDALCLGLLADCGQNRELTAQMIECAWRGHYERYRTYPRSWGFFVKVVREEAERYTRNREESPTPLTTQTPATPTKAPFTENEIREFLTGALDRTPEPVREKLTATLNDLPALCLEDLENRLTAMEDTMIATARAQQSEADLAEAKRQLDSQLRLYRGKMSTPQLVMLEKQFFDRWLLERLNLPRLSLFCLHH